MPRARAPDARGGAPATIQWSDIENVRDVGDTIVILRRNRLICAAIPKADIADWHALWLALEDKLVSKRGLIRSRVESRYIVNTMYSLGTS